MFLSGSDVIPLFGYPHEHEVSGPHAGCATDGLF